MNLMIMLIWWNHKGLLQGVLFPAAKETSQQYANLLSVFSWQFHLSYNSKVFTMSTFMIMCHFFLEFATKTNGKWNCSLKKTISAGRAIVIKVNSTVTSGTEISSLLYDTKQLLQIGRVKDCWLKQTRKSITKVNKFISLKYS